jgi:AraC family transcriptional regulator
VHAPASVQPPPESQPAGQVVDVQIAPLPQVAVHAHALPQSNPAAHTPGFVQSIAHRPGPQVISPMHEQPPVHWIEQSGDAHVIGWVQVCALRHSTRQLDAPPQSIEPMHALSPVHETRHGMPAGHVIAVLQLALMAQAITHVPSVHAPPAAAHGPARHGGCAPSCALPAPSPVGSKPIRPHAARHRTAIAARACTPVGYDRRMFLRAFPRVDAAFRELFWTTNLVVHARGTQVTYTQHTTPLTIKAAWGGSERYLVDGVSIAVDDATYLVLNHGRPYASWIAAARPVESLAVFFRPGFVDGVLRARLLPDDALLDDPHARAAPVAFYERRTPHDRRVSPLLVRMRRARDGLALDELFHALAGALLAAHRASLREAHRLPAVRAATRVELLRRVSRARDAIDSDPFAPHRLDALARIACMAPHHFLRRFRDAFGATPLRYVRKTQSARR